MPWSKAGRDKTVAELEDELKMLIKANRNRAVPKKPPVAVPARKPLPVLGTLSKDVLALDAQRSAAEDAVLSRARKVRSGREADGIGDRYAEQQPQVKPTMAQLLGKRVDVCCNYDLKEGGSELRWSQGLVILVSDGTNIRKPPPAVTALFKKNEAVMISWDANEARKELESEIAWRLLPSKWNPKGAHVDGSWRMDVSVPPTPCG